MYQGIVGAFNDTLCIVEAIPHEKAAAPHRAWWLTKTSLEGHEEWVGSVVESAYANGTIWKGKVRGRPGYLVLVLENAQDPHPIYIERLDQLVEGTA